MCCSNRMQNGAEGAQHGRSIPGCCRGNALVPACMEESAWATEAGERIAGGKGRDSPGAKSHCPNPAVQPSDPLALQYDLHSPHQRPAIELRQHGGRLKRIVEVQGNHPCCRPLLWLTCCPGWASACILVFTVSTGNIVTCSAIPADAPANMCCKIKGGRREEVAEQREVCLQRQA